MYYRIRESKICFLSEYEAQEDELQDAYIGVFGYDDIEVISKRFGIEKSLFYDVSESKTARYESLDGFDFICVNVIDYTNLYVSQRKIMIYLKKRFALFFCEQPLRVKAIFDECCGNKPESITFNRLIYSFFSRLTVGDTGIFDSIEKEIMDLEKALITSKKRDCVKEIISLRKRLMILKKYYEQFLDVLDDVSENENRIFDKKTLRYFKVLENRIDRLYHNVLNLRDYVTQVREAYQAEVDISLNTTMKLFTVVTTIFLPLTLIVGWYGMNLKMPEYNWKYGYEMVIIVSIVVIIGGLTYFKKNNWF